MRGVSSLDKEREVDKVLRKVNNAMELEVVLGCKQGEWLLQI